MGASVGADPSPNPLPCTLHPVPCTLNPSPSPNPIPYPSPTPAPSPTPNSSQVEPVPSMSDPAAGVYRWAYDVQINNARDLEVTVVAHRWVTNPNQDPNPNPNTNPNTNINPSPNPNPNPNTNSNLQGEAATNLLPDTSVRATRRVIVGASVGADPSPNPLPCTVYP